MTFLNKLLVAFVITNLVYFSIWHIVISRFRVSARKLVYQYFWVEIEQKVKKFHLIYTNDNTIYLVKSLDKNNEEIELETPKVYQLKLLAKYSELFHFYKIDDLNFEYMPNRFFSMMADITRSDLETKVPKLLEQYDSFPILIKLQVDGAYEALVRVREYLK